MTTKEYINLAHSYPNLGRFYDDLSKYYNGEWTIDRSEWYPCVILDDEVGPGQVKIVTRNQTHLVVDISKIKHRKD